MRTEIRLVVALWCVVLAFGCGLGKMKPYGEEYIPTWISKGQVIVDSIEAHKAEHGDLPDTLTELSGLPTAEEIPGCHVIQYFVDEDEDGSLYYRVRLDIHMREVMIYDSRGKYTSGDDWGTAVTRDGWRYTRD